MGDDVVVGEREDGGMIQSFLKEQLLKKKVQDPASIVIVQNVILSVFDLRTDQSILAHSSLWR